jgi:hypothetical protein
VKPAGLEIADAPGLGHRYPPLVLDERQRASESGTFRERVRYDLVERPAYAFGLLAAADAARFFGASRITAVEFGVAEGAGLLNLCALAPQVTRETGVLIDVHAFDRGHGLPAPRDHRDHPELWTAGDFPMLDPESLRSRLPGFANLHLGDIAETLGAFQDRLTPEAPIGFVSFDVDIYSSTVDALRIYEGDPSRSLPVSIAYFDDTLGNPAGLGSLLRNRWCGQLRAIDEFNEAHSLRKIDEIRTLKARRPLRHEIWLDQMYGVHALDHPLRNAARRKDPVTMSDEIAGLRWRF